MTLSSRHALYWAPETGSRLARFGAAWLGRDVESGRAVPHHEVPGAPPLGPVTARPRHYGFHATLPPGGRGWLPALRPRGPGPGPGLDRLAALCVRTLDRFRAPPGEAWIARGRAGLTPRQEALLARWGYPWVLSEFAFHLTLTDAIGDDRARAVAEAHAPVLAPVTAEPLRVREICLFVERAGKPFRMVERFPLRG